MGTHKRYIAARGVREGRHSDPQIAVRFDQATFTYIADRAAEERISFAEMTRRLVAEGIKFGGEAA